MLNDPSAERAVLAGIFSYGENAYLEVSDIITESSFTIDSNVVIYKCLKHLCENNSEIDIASVYSVAEELELAAILHKKQEAQHLRAIIDFPVNLGNVRKFAGKIRKLEIARLLRKELGSAQDKLLEINGSESVGSILAVAEDTVFNFTNLLNDSDEAPHLIGDGLEDYIQELKDNPIDQVGIPTGFPIYDHAIGGGLRKGTVNVIGARPKALRHGSIVYTPRGQLKIEDVEVGDIVLHPTHGTTTVTAVWPHKNIDIYRIYFKDGDTVDCCEDHIWHVHKTYGNRQEQLKATKELIGDLRVGKERDYKWNVMLPKKVEFHDQNVSIDPYVMGILLGDGSVSNNTCVYHTMDIEIHEYMTTYTNSLGLDVKIDNQRKENKATSYRINGFQDKLRAAGIFGHNCYSKFVPKEYIYNSVEVRLAVLAGLLDTDGDCTVHNRSGNSRVRFGSVSLQLCKDVKEIVQSLGGLCSVNKTHSSCNGKEFDSYRCEVRLPDGINPFRLPRKAEKFTGRQIGELKRTIVKIEKVGKDDARCLTLSDDDGLFMTDNYVVTHNTGKTLLADNMGYYIASKGIPVLNMDTEMTKEDHFNRVLAMMTETEISDIETGKFGDNPDKESRVENAVKQLKNTKLFYKTIAGKPFEDQMSIMKRWLVKEVGLNDDGTAKDCVIFYDYLKLMDTSGMTQDLKEYQVLGFMMTQLHNFAVKFKVPIVSFIQLNRDGITKESTDSASGSDRIIWLCSNFTIFKRKSDEEIAEDGVKNGNRKLVPLIARHGSGLDDNDYINCNMQGWCAKITEGKTRLELMNKKGDDDEGFVINEDHDYKEEIPFN
jgi:replicative DNA helicase